MYTIFNLVKESLHMFSEYIISQFNRTISVFMFHRYIVNPLLEAAEKFKNSNAFCINDHFYTYWEFVRVISAIRLALSNEKIDGKNIGLVANDDLETYASIFAIWMEDYAYVPLHPQHPVERSLEIIRQAEVALVIDSRTNPAIPGVKTLVSKNLPPDPAGIKPASVSDDSLAYILFTSGSTGKPKGVPITKGNIGAFMKSFWEVGFIIDQNDRCLQCFDLMFDVSVQSYLVPLTRGACTYTVPHDQIKYSYVFGLLDDHKLTFGAMPPSMIRYLKPYFDEIHAPDMRYNILTAEASSTDLVEEWSRCIPNAEIYDFYGPTEATIYCTWYKFINKACKHVNGLLSIGKPMNGLTAIIRDENGKCLKKNEKGELCIAGPQVTLGYWNNPEKNQTSFFEMTLDNTKHRFYKTGDLCYFDDDGDIMYCGRLDYQVKIMGYRVELGEIEYHAREVLDGNNAVALPFLNSTGNTEIAVFLEGSQASADTVLENLKLRLPYYMIPTKVITMDQLPLNLSGKIDRNVLKEKLN
jgi:D-alanine--poly(phosphoribitol) ligase subunit 1